MFMNHMDYSFYDINKNNARMFSKKQCTLMSSWIASQPLLYSPPTSLITPCVYGQGGSYNSNLPNLNNK